jgi:hypothetical protein
VLSLGVTESTHRTRSSPSNRKVEGLAIGAARLRLPLPISSPGRLAAVLATAVVLAWPCASPAQSGRLQQLLSRLKPASGTNEMATLVAKSFLAALLRGDVDAMRAVCLERVSFDGHWVSDEQQLRRELSSLSERARLRALKLKKLLLLSFDEATDLYGEPPPRLADAIGRRDRIALARMNRQGVIVVLTKDGKNWRVRALTD